jgi:alpha-D-xyloside xylohydrolase
VRVRATPAPEFRELPGALLPQGKTPVEIVAAEEGGALVNGSLRVELGNDGRLAFRKDSTGEVLLEEPVVEILHPPGREFRPGDGNLWQVEVRFLPKEGEKFFGLGQHRHGRLDQKGCVLDLRQENCEVSIPFLLSNRGYGFLWHNPAIGRVELGHTLTRWRADASHQVDYWVTAADTPGEIMANYADATGHAPTFPAWAAGFWQCKLRYKTQDELLEVAREYKRRGLPISVIVIDFFHWTMMGDFTFNPDEWPDPEGMVRELQTMGIKTMVSVWPSLNVNSKNYAEFRENGFLITGKGGGYPNFRFMDTYPEGKTDLNFYDPTNPAARRLFWSKIRDTYYRQGFRIFWIDCCEPQIDRQQYDNVRYHIGEAREVACLYPFFQEQNFYEGMKAEGQQEILNLCRSAWAGSQRFGAAVWSGDIKSTFEVLAGQVRAGLNMAVSGIPWWTTDIGGFHSGDSASGYFRELSVRWFQYGVFCPLFRLHGVREPVVNHVLGGQPNEVWCFGDRAYGIITGLMRLRERLRPYILQGMRLASETGMPLMRPLFFDFCDEPDCWNIDDQFMFGPDILVAPVATEGQCRRSVHLPQGASWVHAWTGQRMAGGCRREIDAPLEHIPVFLREGGHMDRSVFADE